MLMAAWLFNVSRTYERRYRPGPIPVLSASWAKHTLEDDPEYHERVASWNKRKKSMWDRVFQNEEDFIEE